MNRRRDFQCFGIGFPIFCSAAGDCHSAVRVDAVIEQPFLSAFCIQDSIIREMQRVCSGVEQYVFIGNGKGDLIPLCFCAGIIDIAALLQTECRHINFGYGCRNMQCLYQ